MVRAFSVAAAAIAVSTLSLKAEAHTNMAVPALKWPDNFYNGNSPMGRIDGDSFPSSAEVSKTSYGAEKLAKIMEKEGYTTLRQLIMKNVKLSAINGLTGKKECGLTITTGEKQPIPDEIDFPWGHPGPCEVWCDNNRIFYNQDCQANNVGKVKVDKTKCAGVNIIQAMYIGVHVANWEVYANCAPMVGGTKTDPATLFKTDAAATGGSSSSSNTPAGSSAAPSPSANDEYDDETTSPAPSSSGDEYADETPAPAGGDDEYDNASEAPAATTSAPAPAASTKPGCKRRMRN